MLALNQLQFALVFVALLGSGLIAGVFFAFSTFVMHALSRLSHEEGIKAMQSINAVILGSYFIFVFVGIAVICLLLIAWSLIQWGQAGNEYIFLGSVLYFVGSLMVTVFFNVPKNEALAKVDVLDSSSESFWKDYVDTWLVWNHVRTVASVLAAASFGLVFY